MFSLEGNSEWSLKGPEPNALDCEARSPLGTHWGSVYKALLVLSGQCLWMQRYLKFFISDM